MIRTVLLLVALCAAACGGAQTDAAGAGAPLHMEFLHLDGAPARLSDFRGRVVVLHLFAVGSLAAQVDTLQLSELYLKHNDELAVVGVALEPQGATLVVPWRTGLEIEYDIVLGDASIISGATELGPIRRIPVTVVLDPTGRVVYRADRQLVPGELAPVVERAIRRAKRT